MGRGLLLAMLDLRCIRKSTCFDSHAQDVELKAPVVTVGLEDTHEKLNHDKYDHIIWDQRIIRV